MKPGETRREMPRQRVDRRHSIKQLLLRAEAFVSGAAGADLDVRPRRHSRMRLWYRSVQMGPVF